MINKLNNIQIVVYRVNPENLHMEFFDKLSNITVNNVKDYIKSLMREDSYVIFDSVITVRNNAIAYMIDVECVDVGYVYRKLQRSLK